MKTGFLERLIERLDRLDPQIIQSHFVELVRERGLLETIFQSIQEGVVVLDGLHKVTYANKAAEYLMGFSIEEAQGKPLERYFRDLDWVSLFGRQEGVSARMISHEIEIRYPEHKYINFYVVPLASADPRDHGAVLILRDVTRDRQKEADTLESERVNAIKLLAAGVAHEIGNPLNALNIHLQLMDRELSGLHVGGEGDVSGGEALHELKDLLDVARTEVSRLDLIITQFLKAIRPSRPKTALTSVESVLEDSLTLLRHEIRNRNIRVEVRASGPLPGLQLDRDQIKQAFFNIIKNALQAMADGDELIIAAAVVDAHVAVAFRDTGSGIPPEDFGHIFDPYYTTKKQGSGLGLMIVQRIVQDHGGQIRVSSQPGQGTEVTVLLPLAERRVRLLPKSASRSATGMRKRKGRDV